MPYHRIGDPERLYGLIEAMLALESDADLSSLLQLVVDSARRLVGARYGALGVLGPDGRHLARFVTSGLSEEEVAAIGSTPSGRGVLGQVIARAAAVRVDDLAAEPGAVGFPPGHPTMRRFCGVPVQASDGHVLGNLYLADREDGAPFSEDDQALVESFGRAAGLAVDQAALRDRQHELTLAAERERLARELHDTVIQRLFAVGLGLQVTLRSVLADEDRERIDRAIEELDETIQEIRTTIFAIDADEVDASELTARLRAMVEEVATRLGVAVTLTLAEPTLEVTSRVARHTLQALREVLANVARHARASSLAVSLRAEGDLLVLEIRDDGVGFVAPVGPGRGLRNLRERAHRLGGSCQVESEPGRGTLVRWTARRMA